MGNEEEKSELRQHLEANFARPTGDEGQNREHRHGSGIESDEAIAFRLTALLNAGLIGPMNPKYSPTDTDKGEVQPPMTDDRALARHGYMRISPETAALLKADIDRVMGAQRKNPESDWPKIETVAGCMPQPAADDEKPSDFGDWRGGDGLHL